MARAAVLGRLVWRVGRAAEVVDENAHVRTLVIDVPGWPGHRAGQHVDIRLTAEDGYQAVRSYSIASAPEDPRLCVTIERLDDGEVSPYLTQEVRAGDELELRGPIGGYFVWDVGDGGPLLLVAGGSGVVPLMSMIRHRVAAGSDVPVTLLYSVRTPEDVIYRAELEHLASRGDGLQVVYTFTRSAPPGWEGYARRIDLDLLREVGPQPAGGPLAYICGPTPFVEAVAAGLVTLGHEAGRVRTERFGPTGG